MSDKAIGFFDSGVGGISVLKEAVKLLPKENFIYYGDSKNAPYGIKTLEEVKKLTFNSVDFLLEKGIKAVVIACNTATSAAINDLRSKYSFMPVIGIEPALKPAVELKRNGKIIIMATPMTIAETKFNNLMMKYKKIAEIETMPCAGLVEFIESGILEGEELNAYLRNKLGKLLEEEIAAIVLGCTHYPFIAKELASLVAKDTPIIDGSYGTSKQLKNLLIKNKLINDSSKNGTVEIYNSSNSKEIIELSYKLLEINS